MKKEWVKPEIRFTTDPGMLLGCLYEVYGQEKKSVLAGKNIRHTMIFPFLSGCWQITQKAISGIWNDYISGSGMNMKRNRKTGVCTAGPGDPGGCQKRRRWRLISFEKAKQGKRIFKRVSGP